METKMLQIGKAREERISLEERRALMTSLSKDITALENLRESIRAEIKAENERMTSLYIADLKGQEERHTNVLIDIAKSSSDNSVKLATTFASELNNSTTTFAEVSRNQQQSSEKNHLLTMEAAKADRESSQETIRMLIAEGAAQREEFSSWIKLQKEQSLLQSATVGQLCDTVKLSLASRIEQPNTVSHSSFKFSSPFFIWFISFKRQNYLGIEASTNRMTSMGPYLMIHGDEVDNFRRQQASGV
jgi:hypothetical protein